MNQKMKDEIKNRTEVNLRRFLAGLNINGQTLSDDVINEIVASDDEEKLRQAVADLNAAATAGGPLPADMDPLDAGAIVTQVRQMMDATEEEVREEYSLKNRLKDFYNESSTLSKVAGGLAILALLLAVGGGAWSILRPDTVVREVTATDETKKTQETVICTLPAKPAKGVECICIASPIPSEPEYNCCLRGPLSVDWRTDCTRGVAAAQRGKEAKKVAAKQKALAKK